MVVLGAVCLMAFVVIPTLWWSRGLHSEAPGTMPVWNAQENVRFDRGPGIHLRESGVQALDPAISGAL
jgi:hypothetical protein